MGLVELETIESGILMNLHLYADSSLRGVRREVVHTNR